MAFYKQHFVYSPKKIEKVGEYYAEEIPVSIG